MKKKITLLLILIVTVLSINSFASLKNTSKYSINENLIEQISLKIPNYTKIDKIPQDLKNAIIAVEDKRFYKHHGFDIIAIGRAIYKDIQAGKIKEGGSTITQQLAKNLFLSSQKTFDRKFKELILAVKLEKKYTKEEILEMYLNVIYYGSGSYGINNASKKYFDKNVWELSLAECSMLVGLPQAPSAYNPNKHYDRAKKRQEIVLALMAQNGFINKETKEELQKQIVYIVP